MVTNERECPDILIEISAIKAALDSVGKLITQSYTCECIKELSTTGKEEKMEALLKAIFKYH